MLNLHLISQNDTHTHTLTHNTLTYTHTLYKHTHILTHTPHTRTHTHKHTLGRTPLDKWSARRKDLKLTKQNTHKRQTRNHGKRGRTDTGIRLRDHRDRHKDTWCWSHFYNFPNRRLFCYSSRRQRSFLNRLQSGTARHIAVTHETGRGLDT
jgi:hypothetical protein